MKTAKELIEVLSTFPPDTRIVVRGYEGGVNDVVECCSRKIALNANGSPWYGSHERLYDLYDEELYDEEEAIGTEGRSDVVDAIEIVGKRKDEN
jgi:hypothetical protein